MGVGRSRELARRAQLLLARVIEEAPQLERAFEPILSSKGGRLRLCGTTSAGTATLSWDDSRNRAALRAPGDFYLETGADKDRKRYRAQTSFATLSTFSAEQELAGASMFLEQLRGTDAELLAALRVQFPHLYAYLGRLADLERTSVIRDEPDHVAIRLRAPLNRASIRAHYPSLDRMQGWIKSLLVIITDDAGRVLGRIEFDGSRRVLCIDALAHDGALLCAEDDAPLRDGEGQPVPLGFDLGGTKRFQIDAEVTTALIRIGRLRLGSCRLPDSRWELAFAGSDRGARVAWDARVGAIGAPRAPLRWLLPLERIFDMLEQSFALHIGLAPHGDGDGLHDLDIRYGLETPRSKLLDLAEALMRWGSRSTAFRGLLGIWHDLAESLAADLEALAEEEDRPRG